MEYPEWLNREEYPFKSHFFRTDAGNMHYVDEGKGNPVVFIHGNPSWSFEFRNLIKNLSETHRCIAADHIGFGLSDKTKDFSYLPRDHAKNLDSVLESLDLHEITLVFGDWGGPIGLSYAMDHPDRIRNIVITNTWLWSVSSDWYYQAFSKFVGGPIGKWLIKNYNFFANNIVRSTFGDKKRLTPEIHKHYLMPWNSPEERKGCWVFPKEITGSSEWLRTLWDRHETLRDKNILIAWGMKDIAFREKELNRWIQTFPDAKIIRFSDAGHFVSEEKPDEIVKAIKMLAQKNKHSSSQS
ncbi:alpha/beta fold hydrolase [Methanolobus bombayensis]|uniref:alpha/beta fold hydrolase n=1 Tax=Methanolobus bombayensis TaxID=38023 RepID=UPI001AE71B7E|nr:alpha/beta fold hydrolase [Methanolobus bombayensis]MBP1909998.1 haloalkane dehalogenase [Methanolobus bombayensis]